MQTKFAEMVGSTDAIVAEQILAATTRDALNTELKGIAPGIDGGMKAEGASACASTAWPICISGEVQ
jgi:hypothetical protein